ncbi:hypothetical protein BCR44DRAFT_1153468 [Catenaria anguillulae PL171]|uniref:DNA polymerase delta/zeta catalytic subunit N-terminal domain-containing protein n=1 Tax=Catenaria anguillulae PL171 TaxID=765915 RepID=A0A1Y2HIT9_9FUNG|nr:hypothetical protein BCR44DRAFT_1153468 [Catenaria anguillulae PL171]
MDNCNRSGTGTGTGAVLSVRIATIDHVLVAPGPLDRQVAPFLSASVTDSSTSAMTRLPKVPVLRVFGTYQLAVNANANANANAGSTTNATTASARAKARAKAACVHIHGVYPYLLVKYTYTGGADQLQAFIHRLGTAINTALSLSASHASRSRPQGAPPNTSSQPHSQSASQPDQEVLPELPPPTPPIVNLRHPNDTHKVQPHVIAIHPIRALPFYGYHTHPHVYLKIHLVDPSLLTRLAQLLASGAILHTPMQPLESHFPYHLQFLADHALDGMGWMHLSDALARPPSHAQGVPVWNTARYPTAGQRATYCDLEVDVHACMIVNYHTRQREWRRTSAASGLSPLQSLTQATTTHGPSPSSPASRFLISSLDAIWDEEARRRSALGLPAYSTPPSESRTHVESPCDKPRWTSELDAVFAARNAREHTQADLVDPEGHQALDAIPWIQESVSFLWPTGFRPDLAAAAAPEAAQVQPVVDQGHEGFGHDAAWRMYPDLVAFSQRAHAALSQRAPSQQDSEDTDKITPPASQNVDEMGDQVDLRLTQQVLEQMLAQESQDVESEIEDDFGDAKVPNGGHDQEHAHGFGLMDDDDDAVFQAAADQFDNFQPLNDHDDMAVDSDPPRQVQHDDSDDDFDLDDHPSFRPSHPPTTTTIPQFNGPGDSSGNDDDAVAPPPRKRHRRKGPPLHKFADTLPPDLPTFSAIANEHLARQDADDLELDSIPCVSVPLGTWSPRDDAEVWSPARPRAGSRAHSEWRLMTGAHELLAGGKDNEARASRADVTYVPSTLPSTRSPETVQASCSTSLDQVDTSVLVDVEHQISPTPRPGPERRLPMLPPTQIPSRRPSALGPASPFIAARPLPGLHVYALSPPTVTECEQALLAANLPLEIHQPPFYGDIKDAHIAARARTFAGREYKIPLHIKGDVSKLPPFSRVTAGVGSKSASSPGSAICGPAAAFWTYARAPPSVAEAVRACALKLPTNVQVQPRRAHAKNLSQLEKYPGGYSQAASPDVSQMATPGKVGGRGRAGGTSAAELVGEPNALLCLGVEVHANSRGELMPDPAVDAVQAVTWVLYSDAGVETDGGETYLHEPPFFFATVVNALLMLMIAHVI